MGKPIFNGVAHAWANCTVNILGRDVVGIIAFDYSDDTEKDNLYGAGDMPIARGEGRYKAEASITLRMEEVLELQKLASDKRLQSIPFFDVIVQYMTKVPGSITTDIVRNCQFLSNKRSVKEGDKSIEVELKLITSHIDWDSE
jgi:hypothetical protein